jgi:dolichol-phosphate mannosyltransferase
MSQRVGWQQRIYLLVEWLKSFRYIKFGLVGASGTVVNLVVLYTAHEYLFRAIEPANSKPYASLALAIAVATVNNFTWNRLWTWSDRLRHAALQIRPGQAPQTGVSIYWGQLGRYAFASWFGIALQYGLTLWLSHYLHYLLANVIAIVIASVGNFLFNDRWTFRHRPHHRS